MPLTANNIFGTGAQSCGKWVANNQDRIKPTSFGDLSTKRLYEVDCNIPHRERSVAATYHTQPMGRGKVQLSL